MIEPFYILNNLTRAQKLLPVFYEYNSFSDNFSFVVNRKYQRLTWLELANTEMSPNKRWALELLGNLWHRSIEVATNDDRLWNEVYHTEACDAVRQAAWELISPPTNYADLTLEGWRSSGVLARLVLVSRDGGHSYWDVRETLPVRSAVYPI